MGDWLPVNPDFDSPPITKTVRGVLIRVHVSPYDVPSGVRGYFDRDLLRFVIDFRYIADEPSKEAFSIPHFTFNVGKNSGRLHSMSIDVRALRANAVHLDLRILSEALDRFEANEIARPENVKLARRALSETGDRVLQELAS